MLRTFMSMGHWTSSTLMTHIRSSQASLNIHPISMSLGRIIMKTSLMLMRRKRKHRRRTRTRKKRRMPPTMMVMTSSFTFFVAAACFYLRVDKLFFNSFGYIKYLGKFSFLPLTKYSSSNPLCFVL